MDLLYPEIEIRDDGIYEKIYNNKGNYVATKYAGRLMFVNFLIENIDTGNYMVELEYESVAGERKTEIFPLEQINDSRKLVCLSKAGVDINSGNASSMFKHLQNELNLTPALKQETSRVGFLKGSLKVFYAGVFIGIKEQKVIEKKGYIYNGKLNLESIGRWKDYKTFIKRNILGNTPLEMALTIGFSGPLVPYLKEITQVNTVLVHTSGQSSTGKSTAAHIVASVFGTIREASENTNTTFSSWGTTENGIESILANNYGIPIILDEFGKKKIRKGETIDDLIYSVTEGKGKVRSNVEGKGLPVQSWKTVVFSTGERTLFENTTNAEGLRVRVLDLRHIAYTESARQSEKIVAELENCSGVAGRMFIKHLLLENREDVLRLYENIKGDVATELQNIQYGQRLAKLVAIILLTVDLLERFKLIALNQEGIRELLIQSIKNNTGEEVGMAEKAYETIKEIVAKNTNRFYTRIGKCPITHDIVENVGECWGEIKRDDQQRVVEIVFIATEMERELRSYDFNNITTVLHELKVNDYLDYEEGKTYRRRIVNAIKTKCYVIKVREGDTFPRYE